MADTEAPLQWTVGRPWLGTQDKFPRENLLTIVLLLSVLAVNAAGLWSELSIGRVDLNDNVYHYTLAERMVKAVEHHENPVDCWSAEWSLGYPVLRTYQPLSHAIVAAVYFALGKSLDLMTVFVWVRFLSVVLLPLSFFIAARLMGFRPLAASAAAILAPLVSSPGLYGLEYGSFVWSGSGLFPQAIGGNLLLLTLGLGYRAIRRGKHLALAGAMLGLTFLAHMIYGYMGALSVCLLAAIPDAEERRPVRCWRVAIVGAVSAMLSAFQFLPLFIDASKINHSHWEPIWKWDSFGLWQVLRWLVSGQLLDYGRFPALTLLAAGGAALFLWTTWRQKMNHSAAHAFLFWGTCLWVLLFCGRPLWGPLLTMLGIPGDMQLHRVLGGAQIFLVLLAAIGLDALWRVLSKRWHFIAAAAATVLLLFAPIQERARTLGNNAEWGRKNLMAYSQEQPALQAVLAVAWQRGGRTYPGLAATWGSSFKIGDVPLYAFLSEARIPGVAFLYHSMALTSDIMVRFNEWNPSQYRLFNIHTVVAPANADRALPNFLSPIGQDGRFRLFAAPRSSYFDLVDVVATVQTTRHNFYEINDRWLQSGWVEKHEHLLLNWTGRDTSQVPRLSSQDALPATRAMSSTGEVLDERQNNEVYTASLDAVRPCFVLFKMTWHPNWKAYLDGKRVETEMLSPGFIGVPLAAGRHSLVMRYEVERWKMPLALAGLAGTLLLIVLEPFGVLHVESLALRWTVSCAVRRRLLTAAGLLLLALPTMIPLLTHSVLEGHDAFEYFPRLVEVHLNFIHGVLIPRWAPDLGRGTGQPLFLFHPPMIYWLGELWHLVGFDYVLAMNLACAVIVLLSAVAMFLLARLYFGEAGGWLGSAALLYAPYFAVDLYVRSAMEEFSAFPFLALALFGFGGYARHRRTRYWLLGAAAFAAVLACHFMAALLFAPLLLGFLAFSAWMKHSWGLFARQLGGFVFGLSLSAFLWIPALAERHDVDITRATQGVFYYANHFVYLHQLFFSPWGYGGSVPGPNDGMSFSLGWSHLLLAVAAWSFVKRKAESVERRIARFFGIAAILLCILMLQDALWFWEQLPLLQYVNLPWRLLEPAIVCVAMVIAALGHSLRSTQRHGMAWIAAALALLVVPNLVHMHPKSLTDVDLSFWTPQQISIRGFESTTMGEITPRWISGLPSYSPVAAVVLSGDADIRRPERTPFSWSSPVRGSVASIIEMQTSWFPGWQVRIDSHHVFAGPGPLTGLITFQVPPGEHLVQVEYGRPPVEKVAAGISIVALLVAALTQVRH